MINNNKRNEIQNEALQHWIKAGKIGTVEIATGVGKTFVFLHALHTMPKNKEKIHLYLAETNQRERDLEKTITLFDKIFKKQTKKDYIIQFNCYQSAYKWENKRFGLVCGDEIHDSLTPTYSLFYQNNEYEALIGLSAKIDVKTRYDVTRGLITTTLTKGFYLNKYCPVIYKYSLDDARDDNLNRDLDIHVIFNKLDDKIKNVAAGSAKKRFYQTEQQAYDFWSKRLAQALDEESGKSNKLFARISALRRSVILYSLPSKIEATKKLVKHLKRTLIFGNHIDSLLKITPNVISSKNKDDKNEKIRNDFESNKIDLIGSFKMLKQGANIKGLDNLVIMSYYSSEKDVIQRLGRARKDGNRKGKVFIFVTENTQEEKWYLRMFENINAYNVISHKNVDECITYINEKA